MEYNQKSNHSVAETKMKSSGEKAAILNAFALSFAVFFGFASAFSAIAGLIKSDWTFNIPFMGAILSNVNYISIAFVTALLAVVFAIIGLITIKKATDKNALSRSWYCVSKVFLVLTIIYSVVLIAIALYSLLGVGRKSGVSHKDLWLNNFLPNLILAVGAGVVCCYAKAIAKGKTAVLRAFSAIAITIAAAGLILVVIQTCIGFYDSKSSNRSSRNNPLYQDIWNMR